MSRSHALVYATLAWVTAVAAFQEGIDAGDSAYLLDKAFKAINTDIDSTANGETLPDGTVAAVACLMNMEVGQNHARTGKTSF